MRRLRPDEHPFAAGEPAALDDARALRRVLVAAAGERSALSYAEVLERLGHRFTRPKMRALCRLLGVLDEAAEAAGEPEFSVLVVRASDRLPGAGWWEGAHLLALGYEGPRTGPIAEAFVRDLQEKTFRFWRSRRRG